MTIENTAPLDMDAVPSAARAAGSAADEMMKRLQAGQDPYAQEAPQPTHPSPEPEPKPTHPTPAPQPVADTGQEELRPETNRDQRQPRTDDKSIDWEHRFSSLRGQFDRQKTQLEAARADAASLRDIIATLEASGPAQTAQQGAATAAAYEDLTEEEKADYGPEFFNVVNKVVGKELAAARAEIDALKAQVGGVTKATVAQTRERMHGQLDEQVPNWREINDDQDFVDWLQIPDPASGQLRQQLLLQAYNRNETARVAHFFGSFLRDERGEAGAAAPQGSRQASGRAEAPKRPSLEDFAAPGKGKSGGAAPQGADAKPVITRADITQFYADAAAGKYRGREAEYAQREKDIFDATAENRLR